MTTSRRARIVRRLSANRGRWRKRKRITGGGYSTGGIVFDPPPSGTDAELIRMFAYSVPTNVVRRVSP